MAEHIDEMVDESGLDGSDVVAVGLATPGTMDIPAGFLLEPCNLPTWRQFGIRDALQAACQKPVTYANDAAAAAFGEFWVGGGSAYSSMVFLTLGTGVGAGIIVNDFSIDGEHSHGAECGHIIIDSHADARVCSCGQTGHLEAYCSATAIVKRVQELLQTPRPSTIRARLEAGDKLTTLLLAEEAAKGDALALEIIDEVAVYLGIGVVTIVHTIDPSIVVLGGAMTFGGAPTDLGRRFIEAVRQEFRRRAFPVLAEKTQVEFAKLGGRAGYIGVAGLARVAYLKNAAT